MDHRIRPVFLKDPVHGGPVPDVRFHMGDGMPHDPLHPGHRLRAGIDVVVDDHGLMAGLAELHAGVGTDETGAAGQQNFHGTLPPL